MCWRAGRRVLQPGTSRSSRWLHSWAYLGSRQPLRTLSFVVAAISLLALVVHVVWLLIAAG